jgi:phospholipid/cholesterol/gamma-HCH transport system substrate-binding protein
MIEITRGKSPVAVKPGDELRSEEPEDMFSKVPGMADKADAALTSMKKVAESLSNDQLQGDLRSTVASLSRVLQQVSDGEGYPHKFLTNKAEAERISRTLASLERTSTELASTLAEVREVAARLRTGPGLAHELIYGESGAKQLAAFGEVSHETAATLKGIREGDGVMHDILYGGKGPGGEAVANLVGITADLKAITGGMRQGKGTVGALLVDPSVYEDMKALLGNVERNDVLRALVRYSIKQDEQKPHVQIGKSP